MTCDGGWTDARARSALESEPPSSVLDESCLPNLTETESSRREVLDAGGYSSNAMA